jgi:hypothetical protein
VANEVEISLFQKRKVRAGVAVVTGALALAVVGKPLMDPALAWAEEATSGSETATGVVFDDRNKNGKQDRNEKGVRNVSVSNGREVVQTDKNGRYEIPVNDETIIFITKPSGYMVPVNDQNLPQFYYIHYPEGSPVETFYPGIEPTGPLPESVDFPLYKAKDPANFKAIYMADPQTSDLEELEMFRKDIIEELKGTDAAFGITAGDLINDPLELFEPHNEIVSSVGVPWWNVIGNHDINYDVPDDTYSTETYKSIFGPTDYSFDYGQTHFVNMDNIGYRGEGKGYVGYLDERRLEWL